MGRLTASRRIMPSIFDELPGFLELGAWTTRHIRPLFDLFRDEDVAPALALIIFGSALVLCFLFIIDSSFIRMQVRRRIRAVRSIRGKVEFAEAMPDIEKLMLRTRYLRHSWQKFRETLIEPSADEDRGPKVVLNTARPQNYFNTAEAGLRFPLYRAMPNLLVGIGLLLTFFGLVTALFFTTVAIKSAADLAASQNALRDLLYAASFKFYTSVAGLGGSIVLTLVLRYGTSAIEKTFKQPAKIDGRQPGASNPPRRSRHRESPMRILLILGGLNPTDHRGCGYRSPRRATNVLIHVCAEERGGVRTPRNELATLARQQKRVAFGRLS